MDTFPIHCPTHGQWWSNRSTQLLHIEQWEHRGGRYSMHVWQYLTLTTIPLTTTSFVRGKLGAPLWLDGQSEETVEPSTSSGSGGCSLRGIMPGSLPDVTKRIRISCNN